MKASNVEKIFLEEGIDREITCPQAFAIAQKHKIPPAEIGRYCNAHDIKIRACQLECFR